MKRKKGKKRKKDQPRPSAPLSAEVTPSEPTPTPTPQDVPPPEVGHDDVSIIGVSLVHTQSEMPKGLNLYDMLVIVTGDPQRVVQLQKLTWSLTGVGAIALGSTSIIVFFAFHYHVVGEVGLASAAVAGIMSLVAKFRLKKKRDSG
jgi:hypothetical protein